MLILTFVEFDPIQAIDLPQRESAAFWCMAPNSPNIRENTQ